MRSFIQSNLAIAVLTSLFGWLVVIAAVFASTRAFPTLDMLGRADGVHYLAISTTGYEFFKCSAEYWPGGWCGNAAWQPLYPLFIRILALTGIAPAIAGLLITAVAGVVFALLTLNTSNRNGWAAWRLGLLVAVAPGMVWMHAVFPITLLLVWSFLAFRAAAGGKGWQAAIWAALAIVTHSSGMFIAAAVAIVLALSADSILRKLASYFAIVFGAVIIWLGSLQLIVGNWQAWWLVQAKYYAMSGGLIDRVKALAHHLLSAFSLTSSQANLWTSIQSWVVILLSVAAILNVVSEKLSRKPLIAEIAKITILGLFPFVVGGLLSISRNQAQTTLFFKRVKIGVWAEVMLIMTLVVVGAQISQLFLTGLID